MMRSLFSGVAGLRTHQTKMDVLGNNIANVNTTSYKSMSITFSDLMYQNTQRASRATERVGGTNSRQIGLGARSGAIATAIEQAGSTQTTNNPFDMQITGNAFFVVNNGQQQLYTRDGSFYVDGAGNLAMQSTGYFVMGWRAMDDADGGRRIDENGGLKSLQIMSAENMTYPPEGTNQAVVSGNIDAYDLNVKSDMGKTVSLEFYDNLGYLYTARFAVRDAMDDQGNIIEHQYSFALYDILDSDGNSIGADKLSHVRFNDNSVKIDISGLSYEETNTDVTYTSIYDNTKTINVPKTGGKLKDLEETEYVDILGLGDVFEKYKKDPATYADVTYEWDDNKLIISDGKFPTQNAAYDTTNVKSFYAKKSTALYTMNTGLSTETYEVPKTGWVSDLTTSSKTRNFLKECYGDTTIKRQNGNDFTIADLMSDPDFEKLTYRILDNGEIVIQNNNVGLTFDGATGKLTNPTDKITLDFEQDATDVTGKYYFMRGFTDIDVDFTTVTNVNTNGTSTINAVKGDMQNLNTGRSVGNMNGVIISKNGEINATYSNGQTKLLGKIATAEFANASGLEKQGDNLYGETLNSGRATIQDVTLDGGYITTGVLEMSNVDLSNEFTNMITTQRGFQANSRIITVSDTLLEELTNLKR